MLTDQELERRKKHIGSSDISVILGLSPWKTPYDLWLEKTGKLEDYQVENDSIAIGHAMEGHLVRWAGQYGGFKIIRNQFRVHESGILSATHDALSRDGQPVGVEAKTAGILRGFADREQWGDEWTDQIPEWYLVQVQEQMIVSDLELVYVPTLLGGRGRVMYQVLPNKDLQEIIMERATTFWEKHVLADIPPEGFPTLELARFIRRTPGKRIPIAADAVAEWRKLDEELKLARDRADEAKAKVIALLGDAEIGESEIGEVSAKKSVRKAYEVKESTVTTVRFKAAKKETAV